MARDPSPRRPPESGTPPIQPRRFRPGVLTLRRSGTHCLKREDGDATDRPDLTVTTRTPPTSRLRAERRLSLAGLREALLSRSIASFTCSLTAFTQDTQNRKTATTRRLSRAA